MEAENMQDPTIKEVCYKNAKLLQEMILELTNTHYMSHIIAPYHDRQCLI